MSFSNSQPSHHATNTTRPLSTFCFLALAWAVPAGVALLVFWLLRIAPFGDGFIVGWDCYTQYVDYFDWLRGVLQGNNNLLYSFGQSLGGGTVGLFAYYTASPLNYVIGLTPVGSTLSFMTLITVFRIGLCSLTCAAYLKHRCPHLSPAVIMALSCGYALCDYTATFSLCGIMWMDALILLPLIVWGIESWLDTGRRALFLVSGVLAVLCCWFSAYMVFLFAILYFFYAYAIRGPHANAKQRLFTLLRFGGLVSVAVLLSLFILLPAAFSQMNGDDGRFVAGLYQTFSLADFPSALFMGRANIANVPQLFCGTAALFGCVLFFCNTRIARRERVAAGALLGFMLISCDLYLLVEVWDGFRMPRGYYCRFAFLLCFLLVLFAARGFESLADNSKPRKWSARLGIVTAVLLAAAAWTLYRGMYVDTSFGIGACLSVAVVGALVFAYPHRTKAVGIALIVVVACETGANYYITTDILSKGSTVPTYAAYRQTDNTTVAEIKSEASPFFRMEKTYSRLDANFHKSHQAPSNEGLVQGYSQIEAYSSCTYAEVNAFLDAMGYCRDEMGSSEFTQPIVVTDALLGLAYVANEDGTVDENPYALGLGYAAADTALHALPDTENPACADWVKSEKRKSETGNPFAAQNAWASMLLGEEVQVYKPLEVKETATDPQHRQWSISLNDARYAYGYIDSANLNYGVLTVGDEKVGEYNFWTSYYVFDVAHTGTKNDDGSITVDLVPQLEGQTLDEQICLGYYVDQAVLERVVNTLKATEWMPETFEDGFVAGDYTATSDTLLATTVPYDEGWTVNIDGLNVPLQKTAGTFIAFDIPEGTHTIKMTYIPKGLVPGTAISIITLVALIAATCFKRRTLRKYPPPDKALQVPQGRPA